MSPKADRRRRPGRRARSPAWCSISCRTQLPAKSHLGRGHRSGGHRGCAPGGASAAAARATASPFATLTAIILASALAGRLGAFRILAGALIPARGGNLTSAAAVLALTALLSALVNLDVAVVVAVPVALSAARAAGARPGQARAVAVGPPVRAVLDLVPMFLIASGVRALLGTGLALHGSFPGQLAAAATLACAAGNLPAAALLPAGPPGLRAAILATTVGPNLLITGSVATLIWRRIARGGGARLTAWRFSALGAALVPARLAAATLGLHVTGVLR
jgi:hypothetical protein